jgi:hypothetical protein
VEERTKLIFFRQLIAREEITFEFLESDFTSLCLLQGLPGTFLTANNFIQVSVFEFVCKHVTSGKLVRTKETLRS